MKNTRRNNYFTRINYCNANNNNKKHRSLPYAFNMSGLHQTVKYFHRENYIENHFMTLLKIKLNIGNFTMKFEKYVPKCDLNHSS